MDSPTIERAAGIVLCGGNSTRMGRPKLWLPFGEETLLQRIVAYILQELFATVIVVAGPSQDVPPLGSGIRIVRDETQAQGPLAAISTGLAALGELDPAIEAAFVSSCDAPLLRGELARATIAALGPYDMAIPDDGRHQYPLAAAYRLRLLGHIRELLESGERRATRLASTCNSRIVDAADLRAVDPDLRSLRNVNTPQEYEEALRDARLESDGSSTFRGPRRD